MVQFEQWDETKFYDRLGIEDHHIDIMGVEIPCVTIPVRQAGTWPASWRWRP
ncbi:MAG: hypothetical protein ACLTYN_07540 [Dysosmobacter welbionis]